MMHAPPFTGGGVRTVETTMSEERRGRGRLAPGSVTAVLSAYLQWATSGPARVATRPPSQVAATIRYGTASQAPTPAAARTPTPAARRNGRRPGPSGTSTPPTRDSPAEARSSMSLRKPRSSTGVAPSCSAGGSAGVAVGQIVDHAVEPVQLVRQRPASRPTVGRRRGRVQFRHGCVLQTETGKQREIV